MMRVLCFLAVLGLFAARLDAATYYVSSEATNGYAVGNDANDGLSKAAPFLTLDPFEAAGFSWSDDDTIMLNGARINCSAGLTLDGTVTIQGDVDKTEIYLRSVTAGANGIVCTDGKTHTFKHCIINEGGCTTTGCPVYVATTSTLCTLVFEDVEIIYATWGIYSASTDLLVDLTMKNCKLTGIYLTSNGNAGINFVSLGTGSAIDIDGLDLNLRYTTINSNRGAIILGANAADLACSIKNVRGTITQVTGVNNFWAVSLSDFATALIEDCNIELGGAAAAYSNGVRITSAAQTVTSAVIRNNRIHTLCGNGVLILGGADGTANVCDGVEIYGNYVSGAGDTLSALHGIEVGGNDACHVYNNVIDSCVYGVISKETTSSLIANNVARFIYAGAAFYAKGADASVWIANGHIVTDARNAKTLLVAANAANNSTGVVFNGNWRYDYAGSTQALYYVEIAADQEMVSFGNNWHRQGGITGNRWYHVDGAKSLAEWNALENVTGETSFQFSPQHRTRHDHRLLTLTRGV